MNLYLKGQRQ